MFVSAVGLGIRCALAAALTHTKDDEVKFHLKAFSRDSMEPQTRRDIDGTIDSRTAGIYP